MFQNLDLLTANDKQDEYPNSWYSAITPHPKLAPSLQGNENLYDVCIVGGGYTGLSSALHLAKRGFKVCVLEANRVGWGASGRNGGQVGTGQRQDQDSLEAQYGDALAKTFWDLAEESKQLVRDLIVAHKIDCDPVNGIIDADHKQSYVSHTKAYVEKLNTKYGYDKIRSIGKDEVRKYIKSNAYFGGAYDEGSFHINPLAFSFGLAKACKEAGVDIFENSKVVQIKSGAQVKTKTEKGSATSDFLVLACNGYLGDLNKKIAARVMPINNFIIATGQMDEAKAKSVMTSKAAVADTKFVINYFRMSKSKTDTGMRMIFGGGENYGYRFPSDIKSFVRRPMAQIFPQLKDIEIDYGWGGTLAITMKRLPHFTRETGNILSCSGYSGQGVAIATLAGKLVAEAISGNAERFDIMAKMKIGQFPGGSKFRMPLLALAMSWYALRDRF